MSTATARSCARTTRGGERGWKAKRRVKASGERMSTRVKNDDVVVCTGGLGFIGSHLCEVLVTRARVVAVDSMDARGPYPERHKRANARRLEALGVEVREMDVASDATAFEALVRDLGGDGRRRVAIAHLAARSGVGSANENPAGATRANVETTAVVMRAASSAGVARVVLASSGSVYGEASMTAEGAPRASAVGDSTEHPKSAYAATKRGAELLAKVYADGYGHVPVVVARIFTVFGPRGRPDMAVWRFIKALEEGKRLTRFGDGKSTWRDYVFIDDVVDALTRALMNDIEVPFSIVNVSGGAPVYLCEVIKACERACEKHGAVDESPPRPGDVGGTFGDISCAERTLDGWRPTTSLADGLARTVKWWRSADADDYREP